MKERSGPASPLHHRNSVDAEVSTHYGRRDRDHELDRMVVAAEWRRRQAKAGLGYVFQIPEKARAA
jgi:hypothetical protein